MSHDPNGNLVVQATSSPNAAPVIVAQPRGALGQIGGSAVFSLTASGNPMPAYQWSFNGAPIPAPGNPSAITDTLQLAYLTSASFGSYSVTVSNVTGSVASQSAALQLDSIGDSIPDSLKAQYFGANWAAEANTAAGADFDGDGISNYQEYLDGTNPADATSHFYALTINGAGRVTVQPTGRRFASSTIVTLTADGVGALQFGGWTGDVTGADNPLTLTMNRDYALTPLFGTMLPQDHVPYFVVPAFTQSDGGTFVRALALDNYGSLMVVGAFQAAGNYDAIPQPGITRLISGQYPDSGFVPPATPVGSIPFSSATGEIDAFAVQTDDKILIGGDHLGIARLNYDGSVDTSFNAAITGLVEIDQIVVRPSDGKILLVGFVSSQHSNGIVQLNADGSEDATFAASLTDTAQVVWQADGKVIYHYNSRFGRLNADGSTDSSYVPGISGSITAMAVRPDGELYVVGEGNLSADPDSTITEYLLQTNGLIDRHSRRPRTCNSIMGLSWTAVSTSITTRTKPWRVSSPTARW